MPQHTVKVCMGSSCFARGNLENLNFLENYIKENNLDTQIELVGALCSNQCSVGPNIYIDDVLYSELDEEKLKDLLQKTLT
jgi:NADH:ubiquinone oxidoreductase subunit E